MENLCFSGLGMIMVSGDTMPTEAVPLTSSLGIPVGPGTPSHRTLWSITRYSHGFLENYLQYQIYSWSLRMPPTGTGNLCYMENTDRMQDHVNPKSTRNTAPQDQV